MSHGRASKKVLSAEALRDLVAEEVYQTLCIPDDADDSTRVVNHIQNVVSRFGTRSGGRLEGICAAQLKGLEAIASMGHGRLVALQRQMATLDHNDAAQKHFYVIVMGALQGLRRYQINPVNRDLTKPECVEIYVNKLRNAMLRLRQQNMEVMVGIDVEAVVKRARQRLLILDVDVLRLEPNTEVESILRQQVLTMTHDVDFNVRSQTMALFYKEMNNRDDDVSLQTHSEIHLTEGGIERAVQLVCWQPKTGTDVPAVRDGVARTEGGAGSAAVDDEPVAAVGEVSAPERGELDTVAPAHEEGDIVIALHGWRNGATTMATLAKELAEDGHTVYAYDQPGSGFDAARRLGEYDSIDANALEQRLLAMLAWAKAQHPGRRIHFLGHSMGGAALLKAAQHLQDDPVVASVQLIAPAVASGKGEWVRGLMRTARQVDEYSEQESSARHIDRNKAVMLKQVPSLVRLMCDVHAEAEAVASGARGEKFVVRTADRDRVVPNWTAGGPCVARASGVHHLLDTVMSGAEIESAVNFVNAHSPAMRRELSTGAGLAEGATAAADSVSGPTTDAGDDTDGRRLYQGGLQTFRKAIESMDSDHFSPRDPAVGP